MKIVGVAILYEKDEFGPRRIYSAPAPKRHDATISLAAAGGEHTPIWGEQGFVTDTGEFLDREKGAELFKSLGGKLRWPPDLYSEDLWCKHGTQMFDICANCEKILPPPR